MRHSFLKIKNTKSGPLREKKALHVMKRLFLLCFISVCICMNVHAEQNVNCWVGNRYYGPDGQKVSGLSKKKILKKATKKEKSRKKRLIIVGASRVYHMAEHVSDDKRTIYICKKGAAYKWLKKTGGVKLRAYLDLFPKSTVVIQLGNNKIKRYLKKPEKYFDYYRELMQDYPKADFYFMDALPGIHKEKNRLRKQFNKLLKEEFPDQYIGGFSYMKKHGFSTTKDGEHYTRTTSRMIYEYILKKAKWKP